MPDKEDLDPADRDALADALYAATLVAAFATAYEVVKSMALASSQAAQSAVRHNAHTATLELATTASSASKILSDPVVTVRRRSSTTVDVNPGAPVVT